MTITTHVRNDDLATLRDMLLHQRTRQVDIVARADRITSREGIIHVKDVDAVLSEDGVTQVDGQYAPTAVFDEGVADKLKIPLAYVRRLRAERPDLIDANINGWLHGRKPKVRPNGDIIHEGVPGDHRKFMLRCYKGDDGGLGVARALLSNRYGAIDNLDALVAVMQGIYESDPTAQVVGCDLTDRKMYVRVQSLNVSVLAPALLRGYRSPYSGEEGADNPLVFAGFVVANSEVGCGALTVTPRATIQVCNNGLTVTKDALRKAHLGSVQEESVIEFSQDTQRRELELITAKAKDAVATFLSEDYLQTLVDDVTERAEGNLENSADAVKIVTKKLNYSDEVAAGVLDCFIRGGQTTVGGVMQAVTAYAQQVEDADLASSLEDDALKALALAAALR